MGRDRSSAVRLPIGRQQGRGEGGNWQLVVHSLLIMCAGWVLMQLQAPATCRRCWRGSARGSSRLAWHVSHERRPAQVLLHAQEAVLAAQSRQAHRCGSFSV
jgi:hypothetical protein